MTETSMYQQLMGERFARLHPDVQRFHGLAGRHELVGRVAVRAPESALARVMAWCLGTPQQAGEGPLRFEVDANPARETWRRHFTGRTMTSHMTLAADHIVENFGPVRLAFELAESAGTLEMRLFRVSLLGMACPQWLMPRIVASERGRDGALWFEVSAVMPWVGRVADYRGHLLLPVREPTVPSGVRPGGTIEG